MNHENTNQTTENNEDNEMPETPARVKELWEKGDLTPEEEKEIEMLLFGPPLPYIYKFKFHSFTSLSKTRDYPNYEWIGETLCDDVVVISYRAGDIYIGSGKNDIKARANMECLASSKNSAGETKEDKKITLGRINEELKLEWVLPQGFIEG